MDTDLVKLCGSGYAKLGYDQSGSISLVYSSYLRKQIFQTMNPRFPTKKMNPRIPSKKMMKQTQNTGTQMKKMKVSAYLASSVPKSYVPFKSFRVWNTYDTKLDQVK